MTGKMRYQERRYCPECERETIHFHPGPVCGRCEWMQRFDEGLADLVKIATQPEKPLEGRRE